MEILGRHSKELKIELSDFGSFLGRTEGCFEVRKKNGKFQRYPHFQKEIGEATLVSGSYVSVDALIDLALWNIDTYLMTKKNRVVGFLQNVEDDSHVKTKISQYQSFLDIKGIEIAKQIVVSKILGQNQVLEKFNLKKAQNTSRFIEAIQKTKFSDLKSCQKNLLGIEGRFSRQYFKQIFSLVPKKIRPKRRQTYKAYDGVNNVFNFGYYMLKMKVHKALLKAHLEPYLGFLHSIQHGKPSLVCDLMELYRYLVDDFLIERIQTLNKKDFVLVTDFMMHLKMGKKIHLKEYEADLLAKDLNKFFETKVKVPRFKHGRKQSINTLIKEETFALARYIRGQRKTWNPRLVQL